MAFQEEVRQEEERLKRDFQESVTRYYQWEKESIEELLDSSLGSLEEEDNN